MSNEHLHININRGIVLIGNKSEVPTTQTHSSPGWLDSTSTSTSFTKHAEIRNISLFDSNQVVLIILIIIAILLLHYYVRGKQTTHRCTLVAGKQEENHKAQRPMIPCEPCVCQDLLSRKGNGHPWGRGRRMEYLCHQRSTEARIPFYTLGTYYSESIELFFLYTGTWKRPRSGIHNIIIQ